MASFEPNRDYVHELAAACLSGQPVGAAKADELIAGARRQWPDDRERDDRFVKAAEEIMREGAA